MKHARVHQKLQVQELVQKYRRAGCPGYKEKTRCWVGCPDRQRRTDLAELSVTPAQGEGLLSVEPRTRENSRQNPRPRTNQNESQVDCESATRRLRQGAELPTRKNKGIPSLQGAELRTINLWLGAEPPEELIAIIIYSGPCLKPQCHSVCGHVH